MIEQNRYLSEGETEFTTSDQLAEAPDEATVRTKTEQRLSQAFSSRLAEYITGLRPEDPKMIERIASDQEIIRAKYKLPSWDLSPSELERALRQIAEELGVTVRPTHELQRFFEENPFAGAVYSPEDKEIAANINTTALRDYYKSLQVFEHELIHAIQDKLSPRMPIEEMEYEAYVAGINIKYLREDPEAINEILFNFLIGSSINIHYKLESERRGQKVVPSWNNPNYFLQKDGIDPSLVTNA